MNFADESALAGFALRIGAHLARFRCAKDLDAVIAAVADVKLAVVGQLGTMHGAAVELGLHFSALVLLRPRTGALANILTRPCTVLSRHRVLSVGAEMAHVLASRC